MKAGLYPFNSETRRLPGVRSSILSNCVYANVVVDIQARELKDKLFTYRIPSELTGDTFIGAQVLVPFGPSNLVGGYVVSLTDAPAGGASGAIKDIADVVEPEPLFDREYIEFLYWIADYYCSNITDVISAAIPSFFAPKIKRVVKLGEKAAALGANLGMGTEPALGHLLATLKEAKGGALSMVALRQRWRKRSKLPQSHFYRALNILRQENFIVLENQTTESQAPKLRNMVVWTGEEPRSPRQKAVVAVLSRQGGQMALAQLLDEAQTTHATIKRMAADRIVILSQEEVVRDPLSATAFIPSNAVDLTDHQRSVMSVLSSELASTIQGANGAAAVKPWLLHGVTGSGKTEIYLRLIEQSLRAGKTALLLVPEISLTPQLASRLKSRFRDQVSIWHSALSDGERYDTWRRLRSGDVRVLLGARSAVLANIPDLSLIILDEEHDGSYKQSSPSPRYHARDVGLEKARRSGAMVILGSATPDVSTFRFAKDEGRILELPERVFKQALPEVKMVDMRHEFSLGNRSIFSSILMNRLDQCLERKEQAILLINRRGYASHVFCRACGHVLKCRNCSVSLVFHQAKSAPSINNGQQNIYLNGHLACHHCGFHTSAVELCPSCRSPFIRQFGLGTQRVQEDLQERMEHARILRLDSDVTARKGAHEEILSEFARGGADILIGTQMVAKGLDIANVTLVGILAADAAFNLPDYRTVERGFQLLTQVSGRAGRGDKTGCVVMQTYNIELPGLLWAKDHDYATFVQEELAAREAFDYPPFSQLIRLVVSGPDAFGAELACEHTAEELSNFLADALPESQIKVMGPAPCLIERLRNKFRFHLIIKNMAGEQGRRLVVEFLRAKRPAPGITMAIDVDALDML